MPVFNKYRFVSVVFVTLVAAISLSVAKQNNPNKQNFFTDLVTDTPPDSTKQKTISDSLKYRVTDRATDKSSAPAKYEFDLKDPSNLTTEVEYDTATKMYTFKERIGTQYYRYPGYLSLQEYLALQGSKDEAAYWKKRATSFGTITKKGNPAPTVDLGGEIFDRLFGGTGIEVKPTGNIDLSFGYRSSFTDNPLTPISQRRLTIMDFDQNFNLNMLAKVGDKMRMNFNYNTRASFDFENQMKLGWVGKEDQIIKRVDLGQVSFPLKTSLIQGVQGLFGASVQMQFGRLMVNTVASQQKSRKETIRLKGGAQVQQFAVYADQYDFNRHFLLDQLFRSNYNNALSQFPLIQSQANITKIEVWVTNRTGVTVDARDIVALADLGEVNPYLSTYKKPGKTVTANDANSLYQQINQTSGARELAKVIGTLNGIGLQGIRDYERTFARKLNANEYTFNPKLGFISLNTYLNPDDVVGVAYQYTYNGRVYQVGEFAQDVPPDSLTPKVLFVKLLKSTTNNPKLPIWDLMMKNIYSLGSGNLSKEDFRLNVVYQDAAGAEKRYLPESIYADTPLISLLNLDRLNNQLDAQPDGVFDWAEGTTINPQQGKVIFPVLEPFGEDLSYAYGGNVALEKKYLYRVLYDSTLIIAQQFPQFNRFVIKGSYRGTGGNVINTGAFNMPPGSVSVTAGGTPLVEGRDYTVDYNLGTIRIINDGVSSSGQEIAVSFENNANFSFQLQNLTGTRFDYFVNKNTNIGGTVMRFTERPFGNKVVFGEDPIKNTVLGLDGNYQSELPWLTRLADRLPIYSTTAPSLVTARAEGAAILPGHSRIINQNGESMIYLDDFESTRGSYDLKFPLTSWNLAAPPTGVTDANGKLLFPEASEINSTRSGINRAALSWYNIDPCLNGIQVGTNCTPDHIRADKDQLSNPYFVQVGVQDVFPQRNVTGFTTALVTMDLAYSPRRRGPYNFDTRKVNSNGDLLDPASRWAGITRYIDQSDFEQSNVEFIEFWLMDPFIDNPNSTGGSLYLNLGNISEDVLKDSRKSFENGLPFPFDPNKMQKTKLAQVPNYQQQINFAFANENEARERQDVGYDGYTDAEERANFADYLSDLEARLGSTNPAYLQAVADPANDNYHYFQGADYDSLQLNIVQRYAKFNNPQGNSPATIGNASFSSAYTNLPEGEDLNRDNTLNETEAYYQYRIDIKPNMQVGTNFIINKQVSILDGLPNGSSVPVTWYQFRVPIKDFTSVVGTISDFRSIRFMRMFLTGFEDSVILRFAKLELGRNIWRKYAFSLKNPNEVVPEDDLNGTTFNLTSVSIEENSGRTPIPYNTPPGIIRQQQQVSSGQNIQLNEQSISMQICGLEDGDARGAFKPLGTNLTQFKTLRLFTHAESVVGEEPIRDGDLHAFIRLGNDFSTNYYEYQIPLKVSVPPIQFQQAHLIWPAENDMNLKIADLVAAKNARNAANASLFLPFTVNMPNGAVIKVIGNPTLADVKTALIGVYNPTSIESPRNDGRKKCAEVWFNELRVGGMNEQPGYAASANADIQVADLATIRVGGTMHTIGYGNIDQKLMQRLRDNAYQYSVSSNLHAGRLFPKTWGVTLPVFVGQTKSVSTPQYDPYDTDNELKYKLKALDKKEADSLRSISQDVVTTTSFNMQNVTVRPSNRPEQSKGKGKGENTAAQPKESSRPKGLNPIAWQNFNASYAFTRTEKNNPLLVFDNLDDHQGALNYTYSPTINSIEPFKKIAKSKNKKVDKYLTIIRDFNFKPLPSNVVMRNSLHRVYGTTQIRNLEDATYRLPTTYFKYFTWNRNYNLRWDVTRSLSFDYNADNQTRIDEPNGALNTPAKRSEFRNNFLRGGRSTLYTQSLNTNYTLPINKIPIFDFISSVRVSYNTTYTYTASSLVARNLGNTVANSQVRTINGDFNFVALYNKSKWLRNANQPKQPARPPAKGAAAPAGKGSNTTAPAGKGSAAIMGRDGKGRSGKGDANGSEAPAKQDAAPPDRKAQDEKEIVVNTDTTKMSAADKLLLSQIKGKTYTERLRNYEALKRAEAKKKAKAERKLLRSKKPMPQALRTSGKFITMLKRANFTYTNNFSSNIPGLLDSAQLLGVTWRSNFNRLNYAFGQQPNRGYLETLNNAGMLSRDSLFNSNFQQTYTSNLNVTATLEPFTDVKIDLSLKRDFNKAYNEMYKDTTGSSGMYHLNPYETGGLNMTYWTFKTLFQRSAVPKTMITQAFLDFENNRSIISKRIGLTNPYVNGVLDPTDTGYAKGYNRYAQEVLIPAFLSAYSGKDANTFPLIRSEAYKVNSNPFRGLMPMPTWRITYNGLAKLPFFRDHFRTINMVHAYNNTLSMNSFNSSLLYQDVWAQGFPSFIDSISGNLVPYFFVPNISIREDFTPFLDLNLTFKNDATLKIEYKRARQLSLSLLDFQVSESRTQELTVGGGMRLKQITLPLPIADVAKKKRDMNLRADFSIRDNKNFITTLDSKNVRETGGQYVLRINPTADYIYSQSLTVRAYYEHTRTLPFVQNAPNRSDSRAGIQLRFLLGQ